MAGNEPPTPKTHFAIMPAKPKGTLADYDAGNLPPPASLEEPPVPHGRVPLPKSKRRRPNPPKSCVTTVDVPGVPEQTNAKLDRLLDEALHPSQQVLADLYARKKDIEAAIRALEEIYG